MNGISFTVRLTAWSGASGRGVELSEVEGFAESDKRAVLLEGLG